MSLFAELRRRNVIRMAGLYLVGAWLIVQVAATLLPVFEAPGWVMKVLVGVLAAGAIPALVFSWVYELTPEGIKRESEVDRSQSIVDRTARKLDVAVIVLLLAIGALTLWRPGAESGAEKVRSGGEKVGSESTLVSSSEASGTPPGSKIDSDPTFTPEPTTSIAVLPFVNMSSDPEQVYFSDGIAEELLNALVKLPDLKVAGRTSSFAFRDKTGDLREIGRALNVNHILEGSVRKQGARIRITAQLVTAEDGYHLWSETYDREAGDVFALQDEITAAIVDALKVKLGSVPVPSAAPIDIAAYELYLRARQQLALRGVTALQSARELFGEVVALEPDYAPAHSGLAKSVALLWTYASAESDPSAFITLLEAQRTAGVAARRALQLDPEQAEAWSMLGYVAYLLGNDLVLAEEATTRSLTLRPRDPEIVNFAGDFFLWTMDPRTEATERLAVELDPLQAANHHDLARVLVLQQRFDAALESAQKARALGFYRRSPGLINDTLVPALIGVGRIDEAEGVIRDARQNDGLGTQTADYLRVRVLMARDQREAASALTDTLLAAESATRLGDAFLADVLIRTGRYDEAVAWLQQAIAAQSAWIADPLYLPLPELLPHPALRAAYDQPEYQSLFELRRRNLAAFSKASP